MSRISLAATLVGLDLPPASTNIEVKPYLISRVTTDRLQAPAVNNDADASVGIDAKYSITANLTADLTYNTDFAQVEVDEQQVNLTRFNLLFPEKRDFFLEGRGIFEFGRPQGGSAGTAATDTPTLFYSRRIGLNAGRLIPIDAGGRVTGRAGKFALGLLSMRTGDDAVSQTPSTTFSVARVKRDILRRSTLGMMLTHRSHAATGPGSNLAYGGDGTFSFFQDISMNGFWARTHADGQHSDNTSYQGRFEYAGDRYGARADHLRVERNFNPEVGFLRRKDFARTFASARFSPRPARPGLYRKLTWEGSADYFVNGAGAPESSQQKAHFDVEYDNSDRLTVEATHNFERLRRPFGVARDVAGSTRRRRYRGTVCRR